jgi:hypothetical protein
MAKWKRHGPLLGLALVATMAAAYAVAMPAQELQQPLATSIGDLATASRIEVHQAGTVVLSGQFGAETVDDDEIKREAALAPTAGAGKGEAEIELDASDRTKQELEVEVEGLNPRTAYELVIDGQPAGAITTDSRGRASVEFSRGTNGE